jgi:hypothetical protein
MPPLRNARTGQVLARRVVVARTAGARAMGLLSRDAPNRDDGIWLDGCRETDTYGMRGALDILFVDGGGRVVGAHLSVPPNHRTIRCPRAACAIQLGSAPDRDVRAGDVLELE